MGFTVPAVHYSALATLPPELTSSKSQYSINNRTTAPVLFSQLFKKFFSNDIHTEMKEQVQCPIKPVHLSENIEKDNDKTENVIQNPNNNNNGGNQISTKEEVSKSIPILTESAERLPFTEPYCSVEPKTEKTPFDLSTYHKHCIRQQKYIEQKQYHSPIKQIKTFSQLKTFRTTIKQTPKDLINYQLKNSLIKFNTKKSNSTTTLPISTSIENCIGLQYASRKNNITTNPSLRSSYIQQETQRLRRLHSKSKIRPISNDTQSFPLTSRSSTISTSIAQRIELLKQSMQNPQLEVHKHNKIEQAASPSSIPSLSSNPLIDPAHKQTQTNPSSASTNSSKSPEIHHIHHHHIYPSSIEWRTYLSIFGTFSIIFLLLLQLTTLIFQ